MVPTLRDHLINYNSRYCGLKKSQRPYLEKYNRSQCKKNKRKHIEKIIKIELELYNLELERRK